MEWNLKCKYKNDILKKNEKDNYALNDFVFGKNIK